MESTSQSKDEFVWHEIQINIQYPTRLHDSNLISDQCEKNKNSEGNGPFCFLKGKAAMTIL